MTLVPATSHGAASAAISGVTVTGTAAANSIIVASGAADGAWTALASARNVVTAGDYTTTSTSFVNVDLTAGTGTLTVTTGARRCLVVMSCIAYCDAADGYVCMDLTVDGVRQGTTLGLVCARYATTATRSNLSMIYPTAVLSAGSHTFNLQWRVSGGNGNLFASAGAGPLVFSVVELPNT